MKNPFDVGETRKILLEKVRACHNDMAHDYRCKPGNEYGIGVNAKSIAELIKKAPAKHRDSLRFMVLKKFIGTRESPRELPGETVLQEARILIEKLCKP